MKRNMSIAALFAVLLAGGALTGCRTLVDECGIRECADDAKITSTVQSKLYEHPALDSVNMINVQTVDKVVYLNGIVNTAFQREIAGSVASQVPGVKSVSNSLGVDK